MPEGVGYASSNVIAGAGLDLNYVGDRVYGYSGLITCTNGGDGTQLSTMSGSKTIVGQYQFNVDIVDMDSGKELGFTIKFNGVEVVNAVTYTNAAVANPNVMNQPIPLVIPPYTQIDIICSTDDTSAVRTFGTFTGKTV